MTDQSFSRDGHDSFDSQMRPAYRSGLAVIPRIARRILAGLRRRSDYAHLAKLPDYLLDDIGLTREDIAVARASAFGLQSFGAAEGRSDRLTTHGLTEAHRRAV